MGRTPHEGIRAQLGSVEVAAAVVYHLGARDRHTRVWARARVRPQPRFALGTRRRRLEQVSLEPDILAWTDRPRHVQSRWTAGDGERWRRLQRAEAGAQRADRTCRVVSDGHLVELVISEVIVDADWLVAAMELVGRIASDDLGATAALAALPGATVVPGTIAVRLAPDDVLVEVDPRTSSTVIHGTVEVGSPRVRIRSADELGRVEAKWATPDVVAAFTASGAATLEISLGETRLVWLELELDAAALHAGITLIRRIAGVDAPSPYR